MKDLKTILTEGFFKNIGAEVSIADIITRKKLTRKIYGPMFEVKGHHLALSYRERV